MKLIWGVFLAAVLLALPAHADSTDTIYDVSGTMSFFGNSNCPSCTETITFSFQLDDQPVPQLGSGASLWEMTLLPGMRSTVTGPLPLVFGDYTYPFPLPDVDGGYIGWDDSTPNSVGDGFALATRCFGFMSTPCTPLAQNFVPIVFTCETAACAEDFCPPFYTCPGFAGGFGIGVPSTVSATVTELGNSTVPEPSTWALLALGLSMFIPLRAIRLAAMWSAGACSRRLPPGLARAPRIRLAARISQIGAFAYWLPFALAVVVSSS